MRVCGDAIARAHGECQFPSAIVLLERWMSEPRDFYSVGMMLRRTEGGIVHSLLTDRSPRCVGSNNLMARALGQD